MNSIGFTDQRALWLCARGVTEMNGKLVHHLFWTLSARKLEEDEHESLLLGKNICWPNRLGWKFVISYGLALYRPEHTCGLIDSTKKKINKQNMLDEEIWDCIRTRTYKFLHLFTRSLSACKGQSCWQCQTCPPTGLTQVWAPALVIAANVALNLVMIVLDFPRECFLSSAPITESTAPKDARESSTLPEPQKLYTPQI